DDVRGGAGARSVERCRLDRREEVAANDPTGDLRPAGVVDDRQPPAADLAEVPPPRLRVPRLAGRAEDPQRAQVVAADRVGAVAYEGSDDGRRQPEVRHPMASDDRP